MTEITLGITPHKLSDETFQKSGIKITDCYQCGKCSAGCPMVFQMDYPPNQLIRLAQLGQKETVLSSKTIWVCVSCFTCSTRCPKDIDIAGLMDTWREMSLKEELASKEHYQIQAFHRSFLETIRRHGRLYEMELIMRYKLRTFNLFQDVGIAPKMALNGKLKFLPHNIEDRDSIKNIFERTAIKKQ